MMTNTYYDSGPDRAAKVNQLFLSIARRYDRLNDLQSFGLHRRWKRRVAELAAVSPGHRALDLCCGTGDLAFALAGRGAEVSALDASDAMLEVARERLERWNAPSKTVKCGRVQFIRGDAQRLEFPDGSFDAVTVGYGLRNLESWETGLREMIRVAKPGGRVVTLDFGKPANPVWRAGYFGYLRAVVPVMGQMFCGNARAYGYILESLRHYPSQDGVAAKMRELGLTGVSVVDFLGGAMSIQHGRKGE